MYKNNFNELISIIVPVYNVEQYLDKCIESIVNQKYSNIEIILIDDGSKDSSTQMCDLWAKKDSRIKVVHKKNEGVSMARNDGLNLSTGKWVTFVDADDWIEENYINSLYANADKLTDMVIGRTIAVKNNIELYDGYRGHKIENFTGENKERLFESIFNDNIKNMKYPHISTCSAKLIRKDIIVKNKLSYNTKLKYYEDALFNIETICLSRNVKVIDKVIYKYRLNVNSSTHSFDDNTLLYYKQVYLELNKLSKKYNLNFKKYNDIFRIKNLDSILINYLRNTKQKFCKKIEFISKLKENKIYSSAIKKVKISELTKRRKVLVALYRIRLYIIIYLFYNYIIKQDM